MSQNTTKTITRASLKGRPTSVGGLKCKIFRSKLGKNHPPVGHECCIQTCPVDTEMDGIKINVYYDIGTYVSNGLLVMSDLTASVILFMKSKSLFGKNSTFVAHKTQVF